MTYSQINLNTMRSTCQIDVFTEVFVLLYHHIAINKMYYVCDTTIIKHNLNYTSYHMHVH